MADMAHGLAHELKQPLQAAMLQAGTAGVHASALRGLPDPLRPTLAALEAALEGTMAQIARTGRLIEHLRRFARGPEEGAAVEPVRVADALDDTLLLVRRGLVAARITLEVDLGDPAPEVLVHRIALEQILINLLNNARDALAARPADAPRRIRITATRTALPTGAWVELEVADTAGGIPDHIIDHVFDPLVTTKGVEEGTGLGLAICRGLARDMDAEITVRNGSEGAVFTLRMVAWGA
jgi:C4-dicarboxylate-specific signal transduction histidine kinase